ncbi:hypothetical protein BDF20DRAFT_793951, partial [Mycotypha africana]|uniref:uncharacterized protein n=1 Tax=Mycotypha africana TaxID=64632 RepID=UPI0023015EA9
LKGPKSFKTLETVDGTQHETFKNACVALHLIDDGEEWTKCFSEAAQLTTSGLL